MGSSRALALITGASAGIGATFARRLAADGYDLMLAARREDALQRIAAEIQAKHAISVETVAADLRRDEDVARLAAKTGGVSLLVNNAGFGTHGAFWEADPGREEDMHRLHVLATERLTRAALPGMVQRRSGGIINVASVAAFFSTPFNVSYCATKAWMLNFTEGLYMELQSVGSPVKVQALCPGYTYTEFHDVLGVDRSKIMTKSWWYSADYVVGESLLGLRAGKPIVIPGLRYRILAGASRFIPRAVVRAGAARLRAMPQR